MEYNSYLTVKSECMPEVTYTIRRISFERRIELTRQIRELSRKIEFLQAGTNDDEKVESVLLGAEIGRTYLTWGLAEIEGLEIDGEPATPLRLLEAGPEALCREVISAVKRECGLTDEERKN